MQDISASRRSMSPYAPVRKAWKNILSAGKRLTSSCLRCQPKPSPISEIPTEILIAIFWSYLEISTDVFRVDGKTLGFTIAHVCHRWREVALDLPFLWTSAQGPPQAIEQIIKRSGSLPISVTIKATPSQPCLLEGTRAVLLHTDRLETLTLVGPAFENALQDATSPAPMLDVLEIRISGAEDLPAIIVPDTIFARQVPNLRILRLSGVSINLLTSPLFPTHLKVLDLHGGPHLPMIPLAAFITFLNQLPRLQILMVKDILSNPGTIRALSNSLTNVPHVSLDYLALLNIGTQWINNFHLLQTRLAVGTNTRVHLHANLNTVESIIYLPLLKFMPPLRPEATPVQVLMLTDLDFRRIYRRPSDEPDETRLDVCGWRSSALQSFIPFQADFQIELKFKFTEKQVGDTLILLSDCIPLHDVRHFKSYLLHTNVDVDYVRLLRRLCRVDRLDATKMATQSVVDALAVTETSGSSTPRLLCPKLCHLELEVDAWTRDLPKALKKDRPDFLSSYAVFFQSLANMLELRKAHGCGITMLVVNDEVIPCQEQDDLKALRQRVLT